MPDLTSTGTTLGVEEWWAAHPLNPTSENYLETVTSPANTIDVATQFGNDLQAAINALPETGGTLLLDDHVYDFVTIMNKSNVHLIGKSQAGTVLRGVYLFGNYASSGYGSFSGPLYSNSPDGLYLANHRERNFYFTNLTFDGDGVTVTKNTPSQISVNAPFACRGVKDVLIDNCVIQNYVSAIEFGLVMGNGLADGVWMRDSVIIDCTTQVGFYLDGAHGGGCVGCTFNAGIDRMLGEFYCNNDFTADFDQDGSYSDTGMDKRTARYIVFFDNTLDAGSAAYPKFDIIGGPILLLNNTIIGNVGTFLNQRCQWFEPPYAVSNPGLANPGYIGYYGIVKGNDVQGSVSCMLNCDGSLCVEDGENVVGKVGKYTVADNHASSITDWAVETGTVDGPNTVSGNTTG